MAAMEYKFMWIPDPSEEGKMKMGWIGMEV